MIAIETALNYCQWKQTNFLWTKANTIVFKVVMFSAYIGYVYIPLQYFKDILSNIDVLLGFGVSYIIAYYLAKLITFIKHILKEQHIKQSLNMGGYSVEEISTTEGTILFDGDYYPARLIKNGENIPEGIVVTISKYEKGIFYVRLLEKENK